MQVVSAQRDFMEPCTRKIKAKKEKNWTRINLNFGVKHPNPIPKYDMLCCHWWSKKWIQPRQYQKPNQGWVLPRHDDFIWTLHTISSSHFLIQVLFTINISDDNLIDTYLWQGCCSSHEATGSSLDTKTVFPPIKSFSTLIKWKMMFTLDKLHQL